MNDHRPLIITLIVVGTIALIALTYAGTLSWCAVHETNPPEKLLEYLKDTGLVALGALGSMLARTANSGTPESPIPTTVVNTASNPVKTEEQA